MPAIVLNRSDRPRLFQGPPRRPVPDPAPVWLAPAGEWVPNTHQDWGLTELFRALATPIFERMPYRTIDDLDKLETAWRHVIFASVLPGTATRFMVTRETNGWLRFRLHNELIERLQRGCEDLVDVLSDYAAGLPEPASGHPGATSAASFHQSATQSPSTRSGSGSSETPATPQEPISDASDRESLVIVSRHRSTSDMTDDGGTNAHSPSAPIVQFHTPETILLYEHGQEDATITGAVVGSTPKARRQYFVSQNRSAVITFFAFLALLAAMVLLEIVAVPRDGGLAAWRDRLATGLVPVMLTTGIALRAVWGRRSRNSIAWTQRYQSPQQPGQ